MTKPPAPRPSKKVGFASVTIVKDPDGSLRRVPNPPPRTPLPPVFPFRWACAYGEDEFGLWQAFEVQGVRHLLRWIPPGEFWMGSREPESEPYDDETPRKVKLTHGFWMAETACTHELWVAVMGEPATGFIESPEHPVDQTIWKSVTEAFIPALNGKVPGLKTTLPTEAQWEYACRAGTDTPFWFGDFATTQQVNFGDESPFIENSKQHRRAKLAAVKSHPPNGWGLYEMHGNVHEWCLDHYGDYDPKDVVDPRRLTPHENDQRPGRATRGGCFYLPSDRCRSAARFAGDEDLPLYEGGFGFRLAHGPE